MVLLLLSLFFITFVERYIVWFCQLIMWIYCFVMSSLMQTRWKKFEMLWVLHNWFLKNITAVVSLIPWKNKKQVFTILGITIELHWEHACQFESKFVIMVLSSALWMQLGGNDFAKSYNYRRDLNSSIKFLDYEKLTLRRRRQC